MEPERRFGEADLRGALENPDKPKTGEQPAPAPAPAPQSNSTTPPSDGTAPATNGNGGAGAAAGATPPEQPVDYQLARALDLLHGIALYRTSQLN